MKKLKSVISVLLVSTMAFSLVGCGGKSFDPIEDSTFEDALDEVFSVESGDSGWRETKNATSTNDFGYYSKVLDGTDIFRDVSKVAKEIEYVGESDQYYYFIEFKDEEEGLDWFEDNFYSDFEDGVEDGDIEGDYSYKITDTMGYVIISGESDSDFLRRNFDLDGNIYGGFYYTEGIFVAAFTTKTKQSKIDDINAFLDAIGYPQP